MDTSHHEHISFYNELVFLALSANCFLCCLMFGKKSEMKMSLHHFLLLNYHHFSFIFF